ncbi:MAG: F0F1 ATP synthase subunit A, partial [Gammaproteobacteria bacterium]
MAAQAPQSTSEYILHHLTNNAQGSGFWTIHVDTLAVSAIIGFVVFGLLYLVGRKASPGVP